MDKATLRQFGHRFDLPPSTVTAWTQGEGPPATVAKLLHCIMEQDAELERLKGVISEQQVTIKTLSRLLHPL